MRRKHLYQFAEVNALVRGKEKGKFFPVERIFAADKFHFEPHLRDLLLRKTHRFGNFFRVFFYSAFVALVSLSRDGFKGMRYLLVRDFLNAENDRSILLPLCRFHYNALPFRILRVIVFGRKIIHLWGVFEFNA